MPRNISTPPGLPGASAYPKIVQIVQLEPMGAATRVTLSGSGYGSGEDVNPLYSFFAEGNAGCLTSLKAMSEAK